MFLVKITQKITGNKNAENKQSKKSKKIRERKKQGKRKTKQKQKAVEENCQSNFERKRFDNLSKLEARF